LISNGRWHEIDPIFAKALERPMGERQAFLDEACAGDAELRREVERLLEADESSATFLERPVGDLLGLSPAKAAAEEAGDLLGPNLLGPYRLLRRIGGGGMGTVYLARREDEHYRREVAVKILRSGLESTEAFHRFLAERQILARLEHPNIAHLYDGGSTEDGRPYLVMELVEGLPLDEYCDRHRLTVDQRLELFRRICSAVQYAHQNLLVHRDLKPGNILVTAAGEPKLLDFGIAKRLEPQPEDGVDGQDVTRTGLRVMTPSHASPEQVKGEAITTASDVYSLGVILYELLAGRSPYRIANRRPHEMERAICEEEPERPSAALFRSGDPPAEEIAIARRTRTKSLARRLLGDLDNVILMALRKEPERRYGSVGQLVRDVENHLESLPVAARPDKLPYRVRKFLRRHRAGAAAAAAMALVVAGFVLSLAAQRRQVIQERDKARYALSFLVDTFKGADPYHTRGKRLTAAEVLAQGARRVSRDLAGQPDVQASLMDAIGQVELGLGHLREAAPLLEGALDRHRKLDAASIETVRSLEQVAELRYGQSDFRSAKVLLREVLAAKRRLLGKGDVEVARTLNRLGEVLTREGSFRQAQTLHEEALAIARKAEGSQGMTVAESLLALAQRADETADYPRAEQLYRAGLATLRRNVGPGEPRLVKEQSKLGAILVSEGKWQEATSLLQSSLEAQRRALGDQHPDVAGLRDSLAAARQGARDYKAAETLYRQALEGFRHHCGEECQQTANTTANLGTLLVFEKRYQEAIPLLERALKTRRRIHGDRHVEVAHCQLHLSSARRQLGQAATALSLARQALTTLEAGFGPRHPFVAYAQEGVGLALEDLDRPAEAESHLRRAVEVLGASVPAGHPQLALAQVELAKSLIRLGRMDEAGSLLRGAERVLAAQPPPGSPQLREIPKLLEAVERSRKVVGRAG
jgi:serine/threonine protein kinase/tetratricopeptide (TPR) repeat protein